MEETLFTVEQVAERLGLHVKTVRNYVREGRLRAVRIGKSYRIAASNLSELTGQPVAALLPEPVRRDRFVEVSSVVEAHAVSPELAERVSSMVMGAAQGRDGGDDQALRVQTIYDATRGRLKIVLIGSLETTSTFLKLIRTLVEEDA